MGTEEELQKLFEMCVYEELHLNKEGGLGDRFKMLVGKLYVDGGEVFINDSIQERKLDPDIIADLCEHDSAVKDGVVYIMHIGKYCKR